MKKILYGLIVSLTILSGTRVVSRTMTSQAVADQGVSTLQTIYTNAPTSLEVSTDESVILAELPNKFKCLDQCAKKRFVCEKDNKGKNKVGTKKNWDESTKCQQKYTDCMDKCQ